MQEYCLGKMPFNKKLTGEAVDCFVNEQHNQRNPCEMLIDELIKNGDICNYNYVIPKVPKEMPPPQIVFIITLNATHSK